MRKFLLVLGMAVALSIGFVTIASADAGPHGNFSLTTDKCAACHRAHTATQADLLKQGTNIYQFCTSCHDGTGATTDVKHGTVVGASPSTNNGGGFEQMANITNTTSLHQVLGAPVPGGPITNTYQGNGTAFGGQSFGYGSSGSTLECTSCHDPHGSPNYRLLKDSVTSGYGDNIWASRFADGSYYVTGSGSSKVLHNADGTAFITGTLFYNWYFDTNPSDGGFQVCAYDQVAGQTITTTDPTSPTLAYNLCSPPITTTVGVAQVQDIQWSGSTATAVPNSGSDGIYTRTEGVNVNYTTGMDFFCATCHREYLTGSGSAQTEGGGSMAGLSKGGVPQYYFPGTEAVLNDQVPDSAKQDIARFRHTTFEGHSVSTSKITGLPVRFALNAYPTGPTAGNDLTTTTKGFTCLTCHYAHGTSANMTVAADGTGTYGAGAFASAGAAGDSALLLYDGRGACQQCHGKVNNYSPRYRKGTPPLPLTISINRISLQGRLGAGFEPAPSRDLRH